MYYFVARITRFIRRLLNFSERKTFQVFPPRSVHVSVSGTEIELVNPGGYEYTDHLIRSPGVWEKNELQLFKLLAKDAHVVFDIGANIGIYSVLAKKANPAATVFAFEPYPANYETLRVNVEKNGCSDINCLGLALGKEKAQIPLSVPQNESELSSVVSTHRVFTEQLKEFDGLREIVVEQTTIDDFVRAENIQRIDLVKLDVEYYEINVLEGGKETIEKFRPAILCEITIYEVIAAGFPELKGKLDPTLAGQIEGFFKQIGYSFYAIGSAGVLRTETIFNHPDSRNFLFSSHKSDERFIRYSEADQLSLLLPI